jgi:hypothetical protein
MNKMEANKWITDKTFAYMLHETGRFVKGEPELCNKFYFRVYPDYAHGITDEDAAKVVSELIIAKEERDLLIKSLESIMQSWDARMHGDVEVLKATNIGNTEIGYWSPASSMVDSEPIHNARKLLTTLKNKQ